MDPLPVQSPTSNLWSSPLPNPHQNPEETQPPIPASQSQNPIRTAKIEEVPQQPPNLIRVSNTPEVIVPFTKDHRRKFNSLGRAIRKKYRQLGCRLSKKNCDLVLVSLYQSVSGIIAPGKRLDFEYDRDRKSLLIRGLEIDHKQIKNVRVREQASNSTSRKGPLSLPQLLPLSVSDIKDENDSVNSITEGSWHEIEESNELSAENTGSEAEDNDTGESGKSLMLLSRGALLNHTLPLKRIHGSDVEPLPDVIPPQFLEGIPNNTRRYSTADRIVSSLLSCTRDDLLSKFEYLRKFHARLFSDASWKNFTNSLPRQNGQNQKVRTYSKLVRWYGWSVQIEKSQSFLIFLHRFYMAKTAYDMCAGTTSKEKYRQFCRILKTGAEHSAIPGLNMKNQVRRLWCLVERTLQLVDLIGTAVIFSDSLLSIIELDKKNYLRLVHEMRMFPEAQKNKFYYEGTLEERRFKELIVTESIQTLTDE
ncbi:hypothetical protein BKA69DRAFT_1169956 [Paraphysoderma sedebokerense]|nr:hypothetical protein BKA69DRAFT_1169956 [Paraphysoderma sedebokerense]